MLRMRARGAEQALLIDSSVFESLTGRGLSRIVKLHRLLDRPDRGGTEKSSLDWKEDYRHERETSV
jgi:hypothetical protein